MSGPQDWIGITPEWVELVADYAEDHGLSDAALTLRALRATLTLAEAALNNIRELNMTAEDEEGRKYANSDLIEQEIVFALIGDHARKGGA